MSKPLRKLMDDALRDIDNDRADAKQLLDDVAQHIGQSPDRYATMGMTAAKYLEVLQRSNEQRVKLIGMLVKRSEDEDFGEVSDEEATEMYEDFENEDLKDES